MDPDFSDPAFLWRLGLSIAIGLCAVGVIVWFGVLRRRLARRERETGAVEASAPPAKKRAPGGVTHQLVALALLAGAAWLILEIWDVDISAWAATRTGLPIEGVVRVLVIVVIAAAGIEFTNYAARALINRVGKRHGDRRRAAKLRTVAPLLSGLANAIIVLVAIAMVLSQAGIEVAPLLAGAGVAGIAIGFGAQSLVKDLFTGAFLIIEDIVSHGDIVEIGGVSGVVEAMTLRTIRVRSYDGTLHIFPYGEALVIHNKTASFSCFAFELQVSYLSDIDAAMETLKRVDKELRKDRDLADCMLGPLDLPGVDRLHDNGVILKGRIRTAARENGRVGAAFLKLAKQRLDEAGVLIAHRHLPVPPFDFIREQVVQANGYGKARSA